MRGRTLALLLLLASLAGACASTGARPKPFPQPGGGAGATGETAPSDAVPVDAYALTATALALRGVPYRDGGGDLNGFDCSGLTQYVFAQYGVVLPREVREQFRLGRPVRAGEVAPGDLVFFSTTARGASHVGIVVGGDQFVHAPSSKGVVRVERLSQSYWSRRYIGARRILVARPF